MYAPNEIEIARTLEQNDMSGMPFALDRETLKYVLALLEEIKETCPEWSPFSGM